MQVLTSKYFPIVRLSSYASPIDSQFRPPVVQNLSHNIGFDAAFRCVLYKTKRNALYGGMSVQMWWHASVGQIF